MNGGREGRVHRGSRLVAVAGAIIVALLAAGDSASAGDAVVAESAHYRLASSGKQAEADEWSRVLEAAWPQFEEFFGASPKLAKDARLAVSFSETLADMQAAIRKAGGTPPADAGGYYDPVSKTAFAFRQPSVWFTRALVLHECAHQFHRLSRVADKVSPPFWYGEGLVDHLSHHTWDGTTLRLGIVPMVSLEDYPAQTLAKVKSGAFKAADIVDGRGQAERPECMHLVRYLLTAAGAKYREKFQDLARGMDRSEKVGSEKLFRIVGTPGHFLADFTDWLGGVQQPWESLWIEWDARGPDALRGTAAAMGLCRRKAETRRLSTRVRRPAGGSWRGGVILFWNGPEDFAVGMIDNARRAEIDRRKDGAWQRLVDVEAPLPGTDETWFIESVREAGSVQFLVNRTLIGDVEAPAGSMGLAVDSASVDFTEIAAK